MPDDEKLFNGTIYKSSHIHAHIYYAYIKRSIKNTIYTIVFAYIPDSDGCCADDDDMAYTIYIYIVHSCCWLN